MGWNIFLEHIPSLNVITHLIELQDNCDSCMQSRCFLMELLGCLLELCVAFPHWSKALFQTYTIEIYIHSLQYVKQHVKLGNMDLYMHKYLFTCMGSLPCWSIKHAELLLLYLHINTYVRTRTILHHSKFQASTADWQGPKIGKVHHVFYFVSTVDYAHYAVGHFLHTNVPSAHWLKIAAPMYSNG